MDGTRRERLLLIEKAIDQNEFFVEYLPTVVLKNGRCAGAEALIRWRHGGKIIPPMEFIPLVEGTPLSGPLTYWVIEAIGREMLHWLEKQTDSVHIGINVPPELFGRGALEYAGKKANLDKVASKVVLEVSERGIIDQLGIQDLNDRLGKRALIALDDVQLKEINSVLLARIKVDIIKLDKAVTDLLGHDRVDPKVSQTLQAIASVPGLSIIAEGVETAEQAQRLASYGIEYGQGWYYSKPISAKAFIEFFNERRGLSEED